MWYLVEKREAFKNSIMLTLRMQFNHGKFVEKKIFFFEITMLMNVSFMWTIRNSIINLYIN